MSSCDFIKLAMPGVQQLHPYQPGKPIDELQRELGLEQVIKLASNENPLGPSPKALSIIRQNLDGLALYPDGNGFILKQALTNKFSIPGEQITLGNGSNDILAMVAQAYAGPGCEIIFSEHAFAVYPIVTQAVGATAVVTKAKDWGHDLEAMAAAVTDRTRIIFLANPNNPTGTHFDAASLEAFLNAVPANVIIVLDEAYFEFARFLAKEDYPDGQQFLDRFPNLIVSRTFSKAYGLAGLRVGYAFANSKMTNVLNRVRQPFNVNSLALLAAEAALGDLEHLQQSLELNAAGLQQYQAAFSEMGLGWIPSIGNFISVDVGEGADHVYDALLHQGVIVRPVANYAMPSYLRFSVGLEQENTTAITVLQNVLNK